MIYCKLCDTMISEIKIFQLLLATGDECRETIQGHAA